MISVNSLLYFFMHSAENSNYEPLPKYVLEKVDTINRHKRFMVNLLSVHLELTLDKNEYNLPFNFIFEKLNTYGDHITDEQFASFFNLVLKKINYDIVKIMHEKLINEAVSSGEGTDLFLN